MVLGKEPGKKLLQFKNCEQKERSNKTGEDETGRILLARHLHIGIDRAHPVDESLSREAQPVERGVLSGKNSLQVTTQGFHQGRNNYEKQQVFYCAKRIHPSYLVAGRKKSAPLSELLETSIIDNALALVGKW